MLAAEVQADLLILMSDVDGIYNKPPWEDGAKLMHTYTSDDVNSIEYGTKSKVSNFHTYQFHCERSVLLKSISFKYQKKSY
ncbi:GH22475 [Drosophila grimshawi]|uniref:GH22475 n=1 Tax=Drosophila grimshawi TaxID=7222 RepID=B4K471_DROGR|nr:GH22475 [Drosophila grimshawi]